MQKVSQVVINQLMPLLINTENIESNKENCMQPQNKHPLLAMYIYDLQSEDLSLSELTDMFSIDDETTMLNFITDMG